MKQPKASLLKFFACVAFAFMFGPFIIQQILNANENSKEGPAGILERELFKAEKPARKSASREVHFPRTVAKESDRGIKLETIMISTTDKLEVNEETDYNNASNKTDWCDYKKVEADKRRKGPGEQGTGYFLSPSQEKEKHELLKSNGFNALVSDYISIDRALKDIRHPGCKGKKYLTKLPKASIVIPFHNEHRTTLLRTINSVMKRSPASLIQEIILVDDFSTKLFSKAPLGDYLMKNYRYIAKLYHTKKREGLIRARLIGAKKATGDVLIFLDSHVEANVNWLPPLLEPIAINRKTVVCPFIDVIDADTFSYRAQDEGARGAFDWQFFYKRLPLLPADLKHPTKPFNSPVMAGGLFAIDRKWFWDLGGYDPGLEIWGGEQYELSFKIWQCGGRMVDAPCSRIGHVYRKFSPFPNPGKGDFVGRNHKRVAEVWMDEYKEYYYKRLPHLRKVDPGNLTAQYEIRKKHNCKPFKWFMENVAFDLPKYYPFITPANFAEGELRNVHFDLCVDTKFKGSSQTFGLEDCMRDHKNLGGEQNFELSWHKDLRPHKRAICFDVPLRQAKAPVVLYDCHGKQGNQHFKYNIETKQLFHPLTTQCIDADGQSKEVFMNPCNINSESQKWQFERYNRTLLINEWNMN